MAETCRRCSGKGDPRWSGRPGSAVVTLHGHKGRGLGRLWGPSPGLAAGHPPARACWGRGRRRLPWTQTKTPLLGGTVLSLQSPVAKTL